MKLSGIYYGVVLFSLLVLGVSCGGEGEANNSSSKEAALTAKEIEVAAVSSRTFQRTVYSTGSLIPRETAEIRALVDGPLVRVPVDIGASVSRGQLLFQTRPIDSEIALQQAEARLATAQSDLDNLRAWQREEEIQMAEAELASARAELERLEKEFDRATELLERGATSQAAWEEARTVRDTAEAQFKVARERLQVAKAGPTSEEIQVAINRVKEAEASLRAAQQQLQDTSVTAPYAGSITRKHRRAGDYVREGDPVVDIADLSTLEAEMRIPEGYSSLFRPGLPVTLQVESVSSERDGEIVAVNAAIDTETRTFLIKVAVDNPDLRIKAGAFCTGVFELPSASNVLSVPLTALHTREGEPFVWVVDEGRARRVFVATGERNEEFVQISRGLEGNELVVVEGAGALSEGDEVQIIESTRSEGGA